MEQNPENPNDAEKTDDTNEEQPQPVEQNVTIEGPSGAPDPNLAADGDEVKDGVEDNE